MDGGRTHGPQAERCCGFRAVAAAGAGVVAELPMIYELLTQAIIVLGRLRSWSVRQRSTERVEVRLFDVYAEETWECCDCGAIHDAQYFALGETCEQLFGNCQDIEWTFSGETLVPLQSRPITKMKRKHFPVSWEHEEDAETLRTSHGRTSNRRPQTRYRDSGT